MSKNKPEKFKELVIYISQKSEGDRKFASTKLNKIVAFSDMVNFLKTGKPITEAEYAKFPRGPVAEQMKATLKDLEENRDLFVRPVERGGYEYKIPTALRKANVDVFSAEEMSSIDEVIEHFKDHNNAEISDFSHWVIPNWDYLPKGHRIRVGALIYPRQYELTPEDKSDFKDLLEKAEWGKEVVDVGSAA
jgi:hypothetical protein